MLNLIVCVDKFNSIGINNDLIYKFSEDLKLFREKTLNKTVVMGRKTFESLNSKPLPKRRNIIISKTLQEIKNCEIISNINLIFDIAKCEDVFIIGGKQIYEYFNRYYDEIHLTKVKDEFTELYDENLSIKLEISLEGFEKISEIEFEKFNICVYKRLSQ